MLVGHPANPPFLLPVIKVVPSSFTSEQYVDRATELYARVSDPFWCDARSKILSLTGCKAHCYAKYPVWCITE